MLIQQAARLRARREASSARATFIGTRMAQAMNDRQTYAYGEDDLARRYRELER